MFDRLLCSLLRLTPSITIYSTLAFLPISISVSPVSLPSYSSRHSSFTLSMSLEDVLLQVGAQQHVADSLPDVLRGDLHALSVPLGRTEGQLLHHTLNDRVQPPRPDVLHRTVGLRRDAWMVKREGKQRKGGMGLAVQSERIE